MVDIIVELTKPKGEENDDEHSRQRELQAIGRYTETPEAMLVTLDKDGIYSKVAEGTKAQMRQHSGRERLIAVISSAYPDTPTTREAYEGAGLTKGAASPLLKKLEGEGLIERFSKGQQDRFRWVQ